MNPLVKTINSSILKIAAKSNYSEVSTLYILNTRKANYLLNIRAYVRAFYSNCPSSDFVLQQNKLKVS